MYKIYSNELKQTGIELYTRYLNINNKNHLETLFALKNDGYSHNYFCDIFFTTEEFIYVMNIDPLVYSKSGWRYWVPGMIMNNSMI